MPESCVLLKRTDAQPWVLRTYSTVKSPRARFKKQTFISMLQVRVAIILASIYICYSSLVKLCLIYVEDDIFMMFKIYDEMNQTVSYKYDSEQKIIIKFITIQIKKIIK